MKKLLKALDEFAYYVIEGMNPIFIILALIFIMIGTVIGIELGR